MSDLFDCLNAINGKNKNYKYKKKSCSGYMLLMWYSHDKSCIDIVNTINPYLFDIPDSLVYTYLYDSIPKSKRYLKWDKGEKDKLNKSELKEIQKLKDETGMSSAEVTTLYLRYIQ